MNASPLSLRCAIGERCWEKQTGEWGSRGRDDEVEGGLGGLLRAEVSMG